MSFLHIAKGPLRSFEKYFSRAGKFYGARCPEEEWIAENLFELANLLRERRLREVKT
jgi:hypothetical protein